MDTQKVVSHCITVLNIYPAGMHADTSSKNFWFSVASCCRLMMASCHPTSALNIITSCHGDLLCDSATPGGLHQDFARIISAYGPRIEGLLMPDRWMRVHGHRLAPSKSKVAPALSSSGCEGHRGPIGHVRCVRVGLLALRRAQGAGCQAFYFSSIYAHVLRSSTAAAGARGLEVHTPLVLRGPPVEAGGVPPRLAIDMP